MNQHWYTFEQQDGILYITLYGQWSEETARAYCEEYKKQTQHLTHTPWHKCVDVTSWECASLSSEKHLKKLLEWSKKNNLVFQVNITNNSSMKDYQLKKIFKNRGHIESHYAKTKNDAIKLLRAKNISKQP